MANVAAAHASASRSVARRRDRRRSDRGIRVVPHLPATVDQFTVVPVLSMLSLEVEAVTALALALLIGSYPDGFVERTWQRLTLRFTGSSFWARR